MKIRIGSPKDFWAGVIFIIFGAFALFEARGYTMGTARKMGPGYFPTVLGCLIFLLGLIISCRGVWARGGAIEIKSFRPMFLVFAGVLAFAFLIRPAGLILALLALVFISSFRDWEFRIHEVAVLYLVLTAMALGIFVYGLGLPFKLFWNR